MWVLVVTVIVGSHRDPSPPSLLQGKADATWIFSGWEGVEARRQGVELNYFNLADHGISYGYAPVLVARADTLRYPPLPTFFDDLNTSKYVCLLYFSHLKVPSQTC